METFGRKALENGFEIIPIVPENKFPAVKSWQNAEPKIEDWVKLPPKTGVGIRTKQNPAIDVDVQDEPTSQKVLQFIKEKFGTTQVVRVGMAPKFLGVFKTSEPFKKMRSKKFIDFLGVTHQVEILADGQFFVAWGIHPKTKKTFKWHPERNPTVIGSEDLVELTPQMAQEVIDYFESIVPSDWAIKENESVSSTQSLNLIDSLKPPLDLSDEKIQHEVDLLDPDISHDQWVKVGMALHHQYGGGEMGFDIWDTWSQRGDKYDDTNMLIKWHSFEPDFNNTNPVTFASVMMMTADQPENDISRANALEALESMEPKTEVPFFKPLSEIAGNIGSVHYLIKNWIESQTMVSIFGDPGSFKSFVAIDMACHIATGTPWKECEVEQGPVLYVAGEGFGGLGKRTLAWCNKNEINPEEVPVYFSTSTANMYDKESAVALVEHIDELMENIGPNIQAVIFDTLARNMGTGDENSTTDMNKFIHHIDKYIKDRYECTVMLVHHTGHKDKHRARGSSSLLGALDHNIRCDKLGKLSATLTATKMKDAEEPEPMFLDGESMFLGTDDQGEEMTSLAFSLGEARDTDVDKLTPKQEEIFEYLKQAAGPEHSEPVDRIGLYRTLEDAGLFDVGMGRKAKTFLNAIEKKGYIIQTGNLIKIKLETSEWET